MSYEPSYRGQTAAFGGMRALVAYTPRKLKMTKTKEALVIISPLVAAGLGIALLTGVIAPACFARAAIYAAMQLVALVSLAAVFDHARGIRVRPR